MPPPRKIDLLSEKLRDWLREEIIRCGYADYEDISADLNQRLKAAGEDLRIRKSAIAEYGKEIKEGVRLSEFARLQDQAQAFSDTIMTEVGVDAETENFQRLTQMLNALTFKYLMAQADDEDAPDARDLHFLGRLMKDLTAAAGGREKNQEVHDERIRENTRREAAAEAELAAKEVGMDDAQAAAIKGALLDREAARRAREILGFA